MEMQDKEFDQLFNSKLSDFEMEPSPMVWDNIAAELDGTKKEAKRSIVPYWSIAASVTVLVAASVLFFDREVKKDDGNTTEIVKGIKPVNPPVAHTDEAITEVEDHSTPSQLALNGSIAEAHPKGKKSIKTENKIEIAPVTEAVPVVEKPEPLLAVARTETIPLSQPVVPANDVPLSTSVLAAADIEQYNEKQPTVLTDMASPEKPAVKKRARGLGGLINTVIAAVDKRDDKLIEFTESDNDEGARITAVNLGIFKIKKQ